MLVKCEMSVKCEISVTCEKAFVGDRVCVCVCAHMCM